MKNKRIVFLGTPEFAACVLEGLLEEEYNVIAVVSQPDKPVGRKRILTPTPVKEVALKYNLPVYQPVSLRKDYEFLKELDFDMLITTAYGLDFELISMISTFSSTFTLLSSSCFNVVCTISVLSLFDNKLLNTSIPAILKATIVNNITTV
jgi:hypothetical protein